MGSRTQGGGLEARPRYEFQSQLPSRCERVLAKEARSVDALPGFLLSESIAPSAMRANGGSSVGAGLKNLAPDVRLDSWPQRPGTSE